MHRLSLSLCGVQCKIGSRIAGNALQATTHHLPGKASPSSSFSSTTQHYHRLPAHSSFPSLCVFPLASSRVPRCSLVRVLNAITASSTQLPLLCPSCLFVHLCISAVQTYTPTPTPIHREQQTHIDTKPLALFAFCSHVRTNNGFLHCHQSTPTSIGFWAEKRVERCGGRRMTARTRTKGVTSPQKLARQCA